MVKKIINKNITRDKKKSKYIWDDLQTIPNQRIQGNEEVDTLERKHVAELFQSPEVVAGLTVS